MVFHAKLDGGGFEIFNHMSPNIFDFTYGLLNKDLHDQGWLMIIAIPTHSPITHSLTSHTPTLKIASQTPLGNRDEKSRLNTPKNLY